MKLNELTALSPLDGRYYQRLGNLSEYFSEFGLIKYRIYVEIKWLIHLANHTTIAELPPFDEATLDKIERLAEGFGMRDAMTVKEIEATTNHDVKACEYFLRQKLEKVLKEKTAFIHFGLTSEDVTNLAYGMLFKDARNKILIPEIEALTYRIKQFALDNRYLPMLARTHGQAATPTTLGKEFANYAYRLYRQTHDLSQLPISGKLNGATGNYNALAVAYPEIDWFAISKDFVESLGLRFNPLTTQIEPRDTLAANFDAFRRIHSVLLDLAEDAWQYISLDYLKLAKVKHEVGSSTMPHKINPINFENAEGNLGLSNAMLAHLSDKLTRSRLQRDLSDSTVLRNLGTALAHAKLAYNSLTKGLNQVSPNVEAIASDLAPRYELLGEAIQTVMRKHGIVDAYEQLKDFSRGEALTAADVLSFIDSIDLPEEAKMRLRELSPASYTGLAAEITERALDTIS